MNAPPVQYVTTSDGVSIAYTDSGAGEPLVFLPPGFNNVQLLWSHCPEWMQGLSERFRLITYDCRGEGFSARGVPPDSSLEAYSRDLEAIVEQLELERVVFLVMGARGHESVRFALAHPGRVKGLVWSAASVTARAWPSGLFNQLSQENWELFLTSLARGKPELIADFRSCVTPDDFNTWLRAYLPSTVEDELPRLRSPVLVMHPRDFPTLRIEESMKVAALIPGARFVPIGGTDLYGSPSDGLAAIDAFRRELPQTGLARDNSSGDTQGLSSRELEVLRLLAAGKSNAQIASELVISLNTVNRHVSNIYAKTGAANRAEAASYATRRGLA